MNTSIKRAIELFQASKPAEACSLLKKIVEKEPANVDALQILGLILSTQLQYSEASMFLEKGYALAPENLPLIFNLAKSLLDQDRFQDALPYFNKLKSLGGLGENESLNYGMCLAKLNQHNDALILFQSSLSINPKNVGALSNAGVSLSMLGRYEEALRAFDDALRLQPYLYPALRGKANILRLLGNFSESLSYLERAVAAHDPKTYEAWNDAGLILQTLSKHEEALNAYENALLINPNYCQALNNKANLLVETKSFQQAIHVYDNLLRIDPDYQYAFSMRFFSKLMVCDWSEYQESKEVITSLIESKDQAIPPFQALSIIEDEATLKKVAEDWVRNHSSQIAFKTYIPNLINKSKLRIGYFSSDFYNHPVSYLTAEIYELHDRDHFEVYGFSLSTHPIDDMTHRLQTHFDYYEDISRFPDHLLIQKLRDLNIDIAIDLTGHTHGNRLNIFQNRIASIQGSYIGYLGTMGSSGYDFIIADHALIPEGKQNFYTEEVAYLPHYQANDSKRPRPISKHTRNQLGLPEDKVIFCCFNNLYKLNPPIFQAWARILKATPNSILLLYGSSKLAIENLKAAAASHGISSDRILFGPPLPREDYLARFSVCDLFLDTYPYGAGTTGSDALWMGLPIITLSGQSFPSRMGASILNAAGLEGLICTSLAEYENLAIDLANDVDKLKAVKDKLLENIGTKHLFQPMAFTKSLEALYRALMHKKSELPK